MDSQSYMMLFFKIQFNAPTGSWRALPKLPIYFEGDVQNVELKAPLDDGLIAQSQMHINTNSI
jgi:hypothetical protein